MLKTSTISQPDLFSVHDFENNPISQRYLEAGKKQFSKNCQILYDAFMAGQVLNSNNSPCGDFRRRLIDLRENKVRYSLHYSTNGRIKNWYMSEEDKRFNKSKFL